jgi:ADP-dependent NAD(P)H-hydrate dehydratase
MNFEMKTPAVDKKEILQRYRPVAPDAHKGTRGHALLIGGSYGKMGAICLASKAALQSGCGLVTAFIPKCGYGILQISLPEAMIFTDNQKNHISKINYDIQPQAIGIGPGMGKEKETQKALQRFLKANNPPLVIDADALNILAMNKLWYSSIPVQTIITPHPKELERLVGKWDSEEEKMQLAIEFSIKYNLVIVMKGAPTHIIYGETVYENTTGNAALATAGSGDVLTGIITGLLAQSYSAIDAALLGVYLHGLTADIALPETGHESFIASDSIRYLGKAFLTLSSK